MTAVATPQKPWAKRPVDRIRELGFLLAAVIFSFGFVSATEMKGKLAYAVIFFVAYGVFTATFAFISRGAPAAKDAFVSTLVSLGAILTIVPMASIIFTVLKNGLPGMHLSMFTTDMSLATPTDPIATGGLLHAITGTLTMVALALAMSIPIGILTALYLTEIKSRFSGPIRFLVQAMSGVPSIVAGLFILSGFIHNHKRVLRAYGRPCSHNFDDPYYCSNI